jgi:hypothetical protein
VHALSACLFLALFGLAALTAAGQSPPALTPSYQATSIEDELSIVEKRYGISPAPAQSMSDRLGALEKIVFGSEKDGTLLDRLAKLEGISSAENHLQPREPEQKPLAVNPQGGFADPEIARIAQMLPLTNESKVNFVRIEPPNTDLTKVGDYFDTVVEASKHRLLRFQHMPVPIYITPYQDKEFMRACNGAFEMWEQRSDGVVRFTQVEDPASARIKVVWSHLGMGQHPNDCVLGAHTITQWSTSPGSGLTSLVFGGIPVSFPHGPKYVVQPQVIEVNLDLINAKPEELRPRLLRNVVAHELGHAVGLMGHSPQRCDLMNALTDECSRLSQRDINTLRKLYNSSADISL